MFSVTWFWITLKHFGCIVSIKFSIAGCFYSGIKAATSFCAAILDDAAVSKGEFGPEAARTLKRNPVAAENEWILPAQWTDRYEVRLLRGGDARHEST